MPAQSTIFIATRGSALALAQANMILTQCRAACPEFTFELKIIKTTGDKLQTASLAQEGKNLPKGLFTKELELALLEQAADLAVHSLKDLPTELPPGLKLGAVSERADVRDVLIYRAADHRSETAAGSQNAGASASSSARGFRPHSGIKDLPAGAVVATSSTRRKAQILLHNPILNICEIRGNVLTRLEKLAQSPTMDGTVLAFAGLTRLHVTITSQGRLEGQGVPEGLLATVLEPEVMLPCVGQGAIGIEIRENDQRMAAICARLDHYHTRQSVIAERSFLAAMGGGCQSPVAAYAEVIANRIQMRTLSFTDGPARRAEGTCDLKEAAELGRQLAAQIKA